MAIETLRDWRIRRFLDSEIERLTPAAKEHDYHLGALTECLKIKGMYFLTEQESIEGERVRREMFG